MEPQSLAADITSSDAKQLYSIRTYVGMRQEEDFEISYIILSYVCCITDKQVNSVWMLQVGEAEHIEHVNMTDNNH